MKRILSMLIIYLGLARYPVAADIGAAPNIRAAELERQIHQQINRVRQNHGLSQLDRDELLAAIARKHSSDMASFHFFNHTNLQGEGPVERAKNLGWNKKKQADANTWAIGPGENIFMNNLYDKVITIKENGVAVKKEYVWKTQEEIAQSTVQGWMDSPPHRKNILSPKYDQQGIGVAISGHEIYVTEDMF
ncbi:CAP domain-containing protein [Methylobacter sp.]|uniref:CAP domain-containing protein n=1 Tax=Methylobacter sp. TaxID=2051955 RepID=UPI00248A7EDF|nr:CAP domain-containing protein [Methylobacter sp.]MDI1278709.1 CAP domain-containing protein [Methylobacter sp.]MDI1359543.1 CAP domain-containing protein [Methylobacter sp.]